MIPEVCHEISEDASDHMGTLENKVLFITHGTSTTNSAYLVKTNPRFRNVASHDPKMPSLAGNKCYWRV
jgi:hypothetical protein